MQIRIKQLFSWAPDLSQGFFVLHWTRYQSKHAGATLKLKDSSLLAAIFYKMATLEIVVVGRLCLPRHFVFHSGHCSIGLLVVPIPLPREAAAWAF